MNRLTMRNLDFAFDRTDPQGYRQRIGRLDLASGEILALLGPNGSGKTTTAHVLGLVRTRWDQADGLFRMTIRAGGRVYEHPGPSGGGARHSRVLAEARNRHFGYVFQENHLLAHFGPVDNAALAEALRGGDLKAPRRRAMKILKRLGLEAELIRSRRLPAAMSGGQQRRVAAARAFCHNPDFLIVDEPSNHLDRQAGPALMAMLGEARDGGNGILLITHDLHDAARYADRVRILRDLRDGRGVVEFFPFRGDRDDPSPDDPSPDGLPRRDLPALPRTDDQVKDVAAELSRWLALIPTHQAALVDRSEDGLEAPTGVEVVRDATALGLGRHAARYAARDVRGGRQAAIRAALAAAIVLGTASCKLAHDLGAGILRFVRQEVLGADERVATAVVTSISPFTQSAFAALDDREALGLKSPPTYRQEVPLTILGPGDRPIDARGFALPAGDPTLQVVELANLANAAIGVAYRVGSPLPVDPADDRGGVLVEAGQMAELFGEARPGWPDALTLSLKADGSGRPQIPGLGGRVVVPIRGVFAYPPSVIADAGDLRSLPRVFLSEGFLDRLRSWEPHYAFALNRLDRPGPLATPVDLVTSVRLEFEVGARPGWMASASVERSLADLRDALGGVVNPEVDTSGLTLRLDPEHTPRHRITRSELDRELLVSLVADMKAIGPLRPPTFGPSVSSMSVGARPLPPLRPRQGATRARLRFKELAELVAAQASLRSRFPELDVYVRNEGSIAKFELARPLALVASRSFGVAGVAGLVLIVGGVAFWLVQGKTAEIAALRAHGASPGSIARVYQLELAMLILPSCALGVALAWCLALGIDAPLGNVIQSLSGGTDRGVALFASRQAGISAELRGLVVLMSTATLALVSACALTLRLVSRAEVADGLRAVGT